jgi:hypothetical protein
MNIYVLIFIAVAVISVTEVLFAYLGYRVTKKELNMFKMERRE